MKKLVLILLLAPFISLAQEAVIQFDIKNLPVKEVYVSKGNHADADVLFGETSFVKVSLTDSKGIYSVKLTRPAFATLYFSADTTQRPLTYMFYLSPGDNIRFSVDAKNPEATYTVTGKGKNNNQPAIQQVTNYHRQYDVHRKDSVPDQVLASIKKRATEVNRTFRKYLIACLPSKEFSDIHKLFVQYLPVMEYIQFKGEQKFSVRKAYYRNEARWEAIEDSLVRSVDLSHAEALQIPQFTYFISTYVGRLKERVWANQELVTLYASKKDGASIMKDDPENLLQEKIIDKRFTGTVAEYLYVYMIHASSKETEDNLPEIYARFKQKYPNSQYISYLEPDINQMLARRKRVLTSDMKLIEKPESYQTLEDVLKLVKGKTVLLDMWGTWCGPCREQILAHSDSIKTKFKGKGLDYLYIANYDLKKEDKWKELIAYYNLSGMHILASEALTKDIMTKINGDGFPTYVLIKKDGTFVVSQSGYPMDKEIMYAELEKVLKE